MSDVQIHAVRQGHAPNCSAAGSVVGAALLTGIGVAALVNAFAGRLSAWLSPPPGPCDGGGASAPPDAPTSGDRPAPPRVRDEGHQAIVAWPEPPALLTVDAETGAALLAAGAVPVGGLPRPAGALSAPTEAHLAVTDRCPVACDGCYLDAGPDRGADVATDALDRDLDALAKMGVFEIALGGGEVLQHPDLPALLARIQARGMVANFTTSGIGLTDALAAAIAPFVGQVNVSVDGLGDTYDRVRGWRGEAVGRRAIAKLRAAGVRVGVNTVLSSQNVHQLEALGQALADDGVSEWQWLRFKPAGRGAAAYAEHVLDADAAGSLWPRLLDVEASTGLVMRVDCALVPFLAAHGPTPDALARLGVQGCVGGERMWARGADGRWSPCSFAHALVTPEVDVPLPTRWATDPTAVAWRERAAAPPAPCRDCDYRVVCRGGCRIVAHHLTGDALAPDPECPRVIAAAAA